MYKISGTVKYVCSASRGGSTVYSSATSVPEFYLDAPTQSEALATAEDVLSSGNGFSTNGTVFNLTATELG